MKDGVIHEIQPELRGKSADRPHRSDSDGRGRIIRTQWLFLNAHNVLAHGFFGRRKLTSEEAKKIGRRRIDPAIHTQFGNDGGYLVPRVESTGSLHQFRNKLSRQRSVLVEQK